MLMARFVTARPHDGGVECGRGASWDVLEPEADRKCSNNSASPNRTRIGHCLNQTVSNCRYDLAGGIFLTSVARGTLFRERTRLPTLVSGLNKN